MPYETLRTLQVMLVVVWVPQTSGERLAERLNRGILALLVESLLLDHRQNHLETRF